MARDDLLFCKMDSFTFQQHQLEQIKSEIASIDRDRLLNTNVDDLVSYIVDKFHIDIPELIESGMTVDEQEAQQDVSGDPRRMAHRLGSRRPLYVTGTEIKVELPFSGDPQMFYVQPSAYDSGPPRAEMRGNFLILRHWTDSPNQDQLRKTINEWLDSIKRYLDWQRNSLRSFNDALAHDAENLINSRRNKLLANQNLVAGLGITLKRRVGSSLTYTAPEIKRKIAPGLPPATVGVFKSEPILVEAEYQHILDVIESMVKVMERSPKVFHDIDEESLRTHFLVQLNGHYEGQATGETFNFQGKTDILVRSGDRNIFIGECKFWNGQAKFIETIDQLLGYVSWRDSKSAILLFNRNKDFSKVLAAVHETVKLHPNFQKSEGVQGETRFRYAFRHKDDAAKIIHVTIMVFEIPLPSQRA
jgi:hypothetical protein